MKTLLLMLLFAIGLGAENETCRPTPGGELCVQINHLDIDIIRALGVPVPPHLNGLVIFQVFVRTTNPSTQIFAINARFTDTSISTLNGGWFSEKLIPRSDDYMQSGTYFVLTKNVKIISVRVVELSPVSQNDFDQVSTAKIFPPHLVTNEPWSAFNATYRK